MFLTRKTSHRCWQTPLHDERYSICRLRESTENAEEVKRTSLGILGHTAIFDPKQERCYCHIGGSSPTNEHDRFFMAPKLRAKSQAIAANASDGEVFRLRAVSSQIGWLETWIADAAAGAVSNIELLVSTGAPEQSVAIDDQLKVFESYERGLMATVGDAGCVHMRPEVLKPAPTLMAELPTAKVWRNRPDLFKQLSCSLGSLIVWLPQRSLTHPRSRQQTVDVPLSL
jgi:hypothetical protein